MSRERQNLQAPIHELIAARWSTRAFDERPVEAEKLASCLEAARWAPSCYNDQPWRFVLADLHTDNVAWEQLLDCLSPGNQTWAKQAPVLILVCASERFAHNGSPNRWGEFDTGQAAMSLCLQATSLGLATHQMGGFDAGKARESFAVPASFSPMSVIALGYPGDPEVLDDTLRQREAAPRQRRPLHEIAWAGSWGRPFEPSPNFGWEARYRETPPESLPWYQLELDADIEATLDKLGFARVRVLDLGTGPGTQAVALAKRGFEVVASDVSFTALKQAHRLAGQEGVKVHFVQDDILASQLNETFDLIVDRGVFHVFPPESHPRYLAAVSSLLRPGGILLLKCFSHRETREEGPPGRYSPKDLERIFGDSFEILEIRESVFKSRGIDPPPKAIFCVLRKKEKPS